MGVCYCIDLYLLCVRIGEISHGSNRTYTTGLILVFLSKIKFKIILKRIFIKNFYILDIHVHVAHTSYLDHI